MPTARAFARLSEGWCPRAEHGRLIKGDYCPRCEAAWRLEPFAVAGRTAGMAVNVNKVCADGQTYSTCLYLTKESIDASAADLLAWSVDRLHRQVDKAST